jgi:hypothetical protein
MYREEGEDKIVDCGLRNSSKLSCWDLLLLIVICDAFAFVGESDF